MANKLYIKEFETLPIVKERAADLWAEPHSVFQGVAVSGTHAEAAAFGAKTRYVCITCDVDIAFLVTTAGTAAVTGTDYPLWGKNYLAFVVRPGDILSAVTWS